MTKDDSLTRGRRSLEDFAAERAADVPGFVRVEHRAGYRKWIADHDREVARRAWYQGATSRQCHCHAYSEGECACGMWPSEPNPYT